jgi:hypothetical protein
VCRADEDGTQANNQAKRRIRRAYGVGIQSKAP